MMDADDDATVEVEDDGVNEEPVILTNTNPNFLLATYHTVTSFLASYGWTLLVVAIILIILWSNFEQRLRKWLEKRQHEKESSELDAELIADRAEAMRLARERMQEKASAVLRKEAARRKELEEKKMQEKLEDYDALKAGKSSHATQRKLDHSDGLQQQSTTKNNSRPKARPLRDDYNPLMGPSSSARHRPAPRRSGGG